MNSRRNTKSKERRFFHLAEKGNRDSILKNGLRPSFGWTGGSGCYVTTNPDNWVHLFERKYGMTGVYSTSITGEPTTEVDVWEVDVNDLDMEADSHEDASPKEDFVVRESVPASRLRLNRTISLFE